MVRFIRIELLKHYLFKGWELIVKGTEMAAVRKDYGTTDDDVWTEK